MLKNKHLSPQQWQQRILTWFAIHGRKTLPWQENKTPYRVWVSEIMLQQTQVATVIPYFERFMAKMPTVADLANAAEDEILHLWTGLGYYNRARNLHKSAKIIMAEHAGQFPDNLESLQALAGIGRSTAGAILAIAFGGHAAILDGNVKRVLTRAHGIMEWPGEKTAEAKLWELAERYTPTQHIADYTQAMMDIGATVCVRGQPRCEICPLLDVCVARREGLEKILPQKKPAKKLPTRTATFLILQNTKQQTVLLEKRPTRGIWGGLWSLPEISGGVIDKKTIHELCQDRWRLTPHKIHCDKSFRHTFSHFHLDIFPVIIEVKSAASKIMEAGQQIWYNLQQPQNIGLPTPVKNLLAALMQEEV